MKRRSWSRTLVKIAPFSLGGGGFSSLVLIAVSAILIFTSFVNPSVFSPSRAAFTDMIAPVAGAVTAPLQASADFFMNASGLAALQAENQRLSQENIRLREWYQTALLLEAENKSLRELMNVRTEPGQRFLTARVLGDSSGSFVKSLMLSAGRESGVDKNQAVLAGPGLIGRVVETGHNASRVLLLTDINSRVPVIIEDSRQHAILAGDNTARPMMLHMPQDTQLVPGARVVTSGHGGIFPQGLAVGRVVIDQDGTPRVETFADFDRLVHVRIVQQDDDPNLFSSGNSAP